MHKEHFLIVSKPRSGSTVLSNMLDGIEDVLCFPESIFPHVLDFLNEEEAKDRRWVGALFVASCPDGSPLSLAEAAACVGKSRRETLDALADALARKFRRDPESIRCVAWKSTRMVGAWKFWEQSGGRFVVLSRNPLNVYESQFRVHFGLKNRNPFRYALFDASYETAFAAYPKATTFALNYASIPDRLDELLRWMHSAGIQRAHDTAGGIQEISGKCYWHTDIGKPFQNNDAEKLRKMPTWRRMTCRMGLAIFKLATPIARLARQIADQRQMKALQEIAARMTDPVN